MTPNGQPNKDVATVQTALESKGMVETPLRPSMARVIREAPEDATRDPLQDIEGMAPNAGRFVLPQVSTIQGLATSISRTYRASDEALQHSWANARYMRNDVGIMECVESRQRAVALLDWHLEPEDKNDQKQTALCAELTKIVRRIPRFLSYRENLLHAIWYGRYANQHLYEWRRIGSHSYAIPVRWLPINGDKLVWKIEDDAGRVYEKVGIRVGPGYKANDLINYDNKVEITENGMAYFLAPWQRRFISIHKHQIEDGAYDWPWEAGKINGVGVRSKIYWEWFQKQELLAFMIEYLERSAFGIEIWYYPSGNPQAKTEVEEAMKQRIGNGRRGILVPKPLGEDSMAFGVDHIEPGLAGVDSLKDILSTYFGHRIKRYILGQTLTTEADATGLGSGLAEVHLGQFMDIVKYDATNLEETITTDLVTPIKDFNFDKFKHLGIDGEAVRGLHIEFKIDTQAQDADKKLDGYKRAWEMGARIKEKDVLDQVGAAIPTEEDHVLENPTVKQQEQSWNSQQAGEGGEGGFQSPERMAGALEQAGMGVK